MRLLLDTHLLLWSIVSSTRLPTGARERLESPDNDVLFSAASIWELTIKLRTGRFSAPLSLEDIVRGAEQMGFEELPVTTRHATAVLELPRHHRDPFDHLLIAQAIVEPARLLTVDRVLGRYSDVVEIVS